MDPHPLYNLFKRFDYVEPIACELSALDYVYEVLLEIHESENCDEVLKEEIYEVIHDSSLYEKHDCNGVSINSINVNCEELRFVIRNLVDVEDPRRQRRQKFLLMFA